MNILKQLKPTKSISNGIARFSRASHYSFLHSSPDACIEVCPKENEVVIALGSNVGDRLDNFNQALHLMKKLGIYITRHGCLYETDPAYITDQPRFLNSAVRGFTKIGSHELLGALKTIDKDMGRTKGIRTSVTGILNLTPDSFSDGGKFQSVKNAVSQVHNLISEGADIIDNGAQSTRPMATRVSAQEELERLIPDLEAVKDMVEEKGKLLSVDTFYSEVVLEAVKKGAHIVNDVSSGQLGSEMFNVVAGLNVPYIAMHMRGYPTTMQNSDNLKYDDVIKQVAWEMIARVRDAESSGISAWRIEIDLGIGLSKNTEQNLELLVGIRRVREEMGKKSWAASHGPILIVPSRKRFLGEICNRPRATDRDPATVASITAGVLGGANIVRVHNVRDNVDAVKLCDAIAILKKTTPPI